MSDREYNVRLERAEEKRDIREADDASADPMSSADVDAKLDQYIALHQNTKTAEAVVASYKRQLAKMEEVLLELMTDQRRTRNGMTLYKQRQLFVSCPKENRDAIVNLACGLGIDDMIVVQPAALKSLVREYMGEAWDIDAVPEELRSKLSISTDTMKLRVIKAGE
jgi:predicted DNA-binding transcriptional regulator YafY